MKTLAYLVIMVIIIKMAVSSINVGAEASKVAKKMETRNSQIVKELSKTGSMVKY